MENEKLQVKKSKLETISIPTLEGFEMVYIADILYLEAENSYTTFYFDNNTSIISTKNMGYYEEEFSEEAFLRVHQSYMVNLNQVKKYLRADNGYIILKSGKPIRVSKSRKEELLYFFKMRKWQNTSSKQRSTDITARLQNDK